VNLVLQQTFELDNIDYPDGSCYVNNDPAKIVLENPIIKFYINDTNNIPVEKTCEIKGQVGFMGYPTMFLPPIYLLSGELQKHTIPV
jgi:hypothetical protein